MTNSSLIFRTIKTSDRSRKGAINEFLGFIFFFILIIGVLVPMIVEYMAYTGQAQELDRLTKTAAKRACSLLADPSQGVAKNLNQGSMGVGIDVTVIPDIVDGVFNNEAAHPNTYFENTRNPGNPNPGRIELRIYDPTGSIIDMRPVDSNPNWRQVGGTKRLILGTNAESSLCPSGGGADWKYCMDSKNDDAVKKAFSEGKESLTKRMELLNSGRAREGQAANDYKNRIERCTVCSTKTRESIFVKTIFGAAFSCTDKDGNKTEPALKILPCLMSTCATEKMIQTNAVRGYNAAYQAKKYLGDKYNNTQIDYRQDQAGKNELTEGEVQDSLFKDMQEDFKK